MKRIATALLALVLLGSFFQTIDSAHARSKKKRQSLLESASQAVSDALVKAPVDQETCFSPVEPCATKLARFMETAQKSLDVAVYDLNEDRIVHQLLLAAKKMAVRVVVDRRQAQGSHSAVGTLVRAGVDVRYGHQRGIMHNKFTIVDGRMVETGSFNYTAHATEANNENQIYLANPSIVQRYATRFNEIWKSADAVSSERGVASKYSK